MEEDIKFIKYYMKQYFYEDIAIEDDFKFEKAIENLLTRYKQLEERVIYLTSLLCINDSDENFIPKSKVKEKIEEINNENLNYSENEYYLENEIKGYAMEHLRELLREE